MLTFTDTKKYVMGIGTAYATDVVTGDVKFFSDKFQEGNKTVGATEQVLNAGIGNGPAVILYSDPNITVNFTQADYDEYIHAAAAGATLTYGAPVEVCQTITATGTTLTIDTAQGTPIAGPGMTNVLAYVQQVGAGSTVAQGGVAYTVGADGTITGFNATAGTTYLVTYYKAQANASLTTYGANFKSAVVRFVYRQPIYTNFNAATNQGDLWGWKITIIPFLKLNPSTATQNGSQTAFTTTAITGRALTYDDPVIGECADCTLPGAPLAYTVIAPCATDGGVDGIIGVLGGAVALTVGQTYQLRPAVVVGNNISYGVPATDFTYATASGTIATVGAATGLVTAAGAGSTTITVTYALGGTTYTDTIDVDVTAG